MLSVADMARRSRGDGALLRDRRWAGEARAAGYCAAGLLAALLALDAGAGTLDRWRALLWCGCALAALAVLLPARVTSGDGWIRATAVLVRHRVRTDRLVLARLSGVTVPRLVLRDRDGGRVELDLRTLEANPALWHRIERAVHDARRAGRIGDDTAPLARIAARVDDRALRLLAPSLSAPPAAADAPRSAPPKGPRGVRRRRR